MSLQGITDRFQKTSFLYKSENMPGNRITGVYILILIGVVDNTGGMTPKFFRQIVIS